MQKSSLSVPFDGRTVQVAVAFRESGRDVLFMIHGLGCAKESFQPIWSHPLLNEFSILAPDLPGFGDSEKKEEFSYRLEDHARICAEILKTLGAEKIHIVAHSMGGAVGLLLPSPVLNTISTFADLEGNLVGEDCGLISRKTAAIPFEAFKQNMLPELVRFSGSLGANTFYIASAMPLALHQSAASLVEWSDSGELLARFKRLDCEKAYLYGEKSAGLKVLPLIDTDERIEISGSGHFLMKDNPGAVCRAVKTLTDKTGGYR